jgi:hypothetical protein
MEDTKTDLQEVELGAGEWVRLIWLRIELDGALL